MTAATNTPNVAGRVGLSGHKVRAAAIRSSIPRLLGPTGSMVFFFLADYLPDVRPSVGTLSERTGLAPRTINDHLARFKTCGLIEAVEDRWAGDGGQDPSRRILADLTDPAVVRQIEDRLRDQGGGMRDAAPGGGAEPCTQRHKPEQDSNKKKKRELFQVSNCSDLDRQEDQGENQVVRKSEGPNLVARLASIGYGGIGDRIKLAHDHPEKVGPILDELRQRGEHIRNPAGWVRRQLEHANVVEARKPSPPRRTREENKQEALRQLRMLKAQEMFKPQEALAIGGAA